MSGGHDLRRLALGTLLASFPGADVPSWMWRAADGGLGGVCLYGSNRDADVAAVAAALHAVRPELVVALDEEGGDVTRLEAAVGSSVPGNAALGAIDDETLTRAVGRALGDLLRATGVDLDLAPCADANSDPANPVIGVRSFGADADQVAVHTAAFVAGLQAAGVAACVKHFPGHGETAVDSHLALPTVATTAEVLRWRELVPFRAAIDVGVQAVMPGHLLVPALDPDGPATVSRPHRHRPAARRAGVHRRHRDGRPRHGRRRGPGGHPGHGRRRAGGRSRPLLPRPRQRRGPGGGVRRRGAGRGHVGCAAGCPAGRGGRSRRRPALRLGLGRRCGPGPALRT